jgi:hypothetical protein
MRWERIAELRAVLTEQPALAREVRRLPLLEQLRLTLELLGPVETDEELPPNVVLFRPRRPRD